MFTKRLIAILAVVALVIAAMLIVRMTTATSTQVSSSTAIMANLAPAPAGEIRLAGVEANDFFERHPELTGGHLAFVSESFASDWFERHPEVVSVAAVAEANDYVQRHPEVMNAANATDYSDYYQRHGDVYRSSSRDSSDWFLRHPESASR